MNKMSSETGISKDVIEKVRDALCARGLTLAGSIGRIIIMLPERGRVNVMARDASGTEHAVTLFLDETGALCVRTADEFINVRYIDTQSSSNVSSDVKTKSKGLIGRRKR